MTNNLILYFSWQQFQEISGAQGIVGSSGSTTPGPPPYELVTQNDGTSELPPPNYAEALALFGQTDFQGKIIVKTLQTYIIKINVKIYYRYKIL